MKIVKHGKKSSDLWKGSCNKCGCIVIAKSIELTIQKGDYLSDFKDFAWNGCPEPFCDNVIYFHRMNKNKK